MKARYPLERLIFAAAIGADPQTKSGESTGYRASMLWAAGIGRAAYDPETISMLTMVLERALLALPRQDRTEERKTRLASSILGAAARGSETPYCFTPRHWAAALGNLPFGEGPASQPIRSILRSSAPRSSPSRIDVGANDAWTTLAKRCEDFNVPDVTEK